MNEEWTLSIEEKILLAEKVMGWVQYHDYVPKVDGVSYYFMIGNEIYAPQGKGYSRFFWQPETDEGDAVRLMMSLPQIELFKFTDGEIKAHSSWLNAVRSKNFCETICLLALMYAKGISND